jgi:predicted permease
MGRRLLETVERDLLSGVRQVRRSPLFTGAAVVSLALGIGANSAIFSLLDQTLWRPLPVKKPQDLVYLYQPGPLHGHTNTDEPDGPSFSYPLMRGLQRAQTPFTGLAGSRPAAVVLSWSGEASLVTAYRVSGNYFDVMSVRPSLGRLFTAADDLTPGAHPVVVLSHQYWVARFGADLSLVGRAVSINSVPMTIVGVTQRGFFGEHHGKTPQIYVPICMNREMDPGWRYGFDDRNEHWVTLLARLKPGITRERAELELNVTYRDEVEKDLVDLHQSDTAYLAQYRAKRVVLRPGVRGRGGALNERADIRARLLVLPGLTALVLLIACANAANLQLAHGENRLREVFTRLALGASRASLVRQLLVESGLLAFAGGVLGLALAKFLMPILGMSVANTPVGPLSVDIDARILAFAAAVSLLTSVSCGLYPALRLSRQDVATALKAQSSQVSARRAMGAFRRALVAGQLALSLVLLIGAGLLTRTLIKVSQIDVGFDPERLLTFSLPPEPNRYTDDAAAALYQDLRSRLAALPGVRLVGTTRWPVVAGSRSGGEVTILDGAPSDAPAGSCAYSAVDHQLLRTLGVEVIAGRDFDRQDTLAGPRAAIVNATFAGHFFGTQPPLGRRFASSGHREPLEIVGVVKDGKYSFLREATERFYYVPLLERDVDDGRTFYLRTDIPPENVASLVRREVAAIDPNVPLRNLKTVSQQIEQNARNERGVFRLAASFGGLATLLAGIGLYGVLTYSLASRTREIGIRMALGAGPREVRALLVREVSVLLAIGGVLGVAGAVGFGRLLSAILYGVEPGDLGVHVSALLVLGAVAALAAYLPARRAVSVDPVLALRHD